MRTLGGAEGGFASWLCLYLDELRSRRYSLAHQVNLARALTQLFEHLQSQGVTDVRSVREEQLLAYARWLLSLKSRRGGPLAPSTRKDRLSFVRSFFAHLKKRGMILEDPAREIPLPKLSRLPRALLSIGQAERLMNAPQRWTVFGQRDRALLETLYGTAVRLSECVRLNLGDLDLSQALLLVRNGKGRKDRYVPVLGRACLALDVYLRQSRPALLRGAGETALFLSRLGRRLSAVRLARLVKDYGRTIGVGVSPHDLRHACATHLLKGGADIRHVQRLLGHKDLQTTALYTRVVVEDLREVLRRAHPRERRTI